jgi:hypothetical protein
MKSLATRSFSPSLLRKYRKGKSIFLSKCQGLFDWIGLSVAQRDDYYSPLPNITKLKNNFKRWNKPSALTGVEYNLEEMKSDLTYLYSRYFEEFSKITPHKELMKIGYGQGYTEIDAMLLYFKIREIRPKRYIEVGSGLSTYYCSLAAQKNEEEGFPTQIICIEPYPYKKLSEIKNIEVVAKEVQEVDLSFFRQLEKNDVFFIDSSHILRIDGDVPYLFLEVLPSLNSGVAVHIHDIPFPYNIPYPPEFWIIEQRWPVFWNEAMVLQAFLCFNKSFKVTMSMPMIRYFDEPYLKQQLAIYKSIDQDRITFSSIWLQRIN